MIKLNRNLRTKPTVQILQKKQKSAPSLSKKRKVGDLLIGTFVPPKERKSGTKKKENYINIYKRKTSKRKIVHFVLSSSFACF